MLSFIMNFFGSSASLPQMVENGVRVIFMEGQSNMGGRAYNSNAQPSEIGVQNNVNIWNRTSSLWETLNIGVNNLGSASDEHGIELGLALYFNDLFPNETLYIIKRFSGGTALNYWIPKAPDSTDPNDGILYDSAYISYFQPAINALISQGLIPYVHHVHSQGEDDTSPVLTPLFPAKFDIWTTAWQHNIGADVPMCIYEIIENNADDIPINDTFYAKALTEPKMQVLDIKNLPDNNDGTDVHYGYEAQKSAALQCLQYFRSNLGVPIDTPLTINDKYVLV